MRYRFRISRLQTADRTIQAKTEESALNKLRAELREPYGLIGGWQQSGEIEIELVGTEDTYQGGRPLPVDKDGPLLLSVKDAATLLGISRTSLYQMIQTGEIESLTLGSRRLISRTKLHDFVEGHG